MKILLERFAYTPENTQGRIIVGDWSCYTLGRPWIPWKYRGGKPFESCIPDGEYELIPYMRANGDRALAMVNPNLGVYFRDVDRPVGQDGHRQGRFKTLLHGRANYVGDVDGCEAVGRIRRIARNPKTDMVEQMVTHSTLTMIELLSRVGWERGHSITIRSTPGATDIPRAA